ncbi:MAG TPA: hypothetical protein PKL97_00535 [Candidatus Omnitrophota bacterium]|nr:hypothetical protein [Candidatus Omnitrophota bacterium]
MERSKLCVCGVSVACSLLWGGAVFFVGIANVKWPEYGKAFLDLASSIYPGYHALPTLKSVLVGTAYALLDGAVGGALFALIYNLCPWGIKCCQEKK